MTQYFDPFTINNRRIDGCLNKRKIAEWQSCQGREEMAQGLRRSEGFARERYGWIALSVLLAALIVGLVFQCVRLGEKLREVEREEESLRATPETWKGGSLLRSWDIANLQKNGLSDPEEDLISDLVQHRELIPYEGVMGGTMGFYAKKDIHVLTARWILASFEDGHIGGCMLLEYQVSPEGEIQWNVLSAYLD